MLSVGSSRSHSSSLEQSQSESVSDARATSFGSSFGTGSSVGRSSSRSSVFGADVFEALFRDSANVAASIGTGGLTQTANTLFQTGGDLLGELEALAGDEAAGAGEAYLTGRVNGANPLVDEAIAGLEADLTEFFGETVLPGIQGDAIAAGQVGGSRQGVAQGIAGRGLLRELTRGVLGIRTADLAQRDAAGGTLAGIQANRRLGAAGTGIAATPTLLGLAEGGLMAGFSPFLALSNILGGPQVLTDSEAFDVSEQRSGSEEGSESVSSSRSSSSSYGTSNSKSKSFSFGIGG